MHTIPNDTVATHQTLLKTFLTVVNFFFLFSAGTNIKVQIEEFSKEGKKLVLSMAFENRAAVGALSGIASSKWLNGVVQSVSNFGIFVRPAGYEMTGKARYLQQTSYQNHIYELNITTNDDV
jgi:hypothetical protein